MTKQEKTKRKDAQRNEQIILKTTKEMIQDNDDILALSMAEVAKRANVGVGTLYRHFESKSKLCQAVIDHQVEAMFSDINNFLEKHPEESLYNRIYGILRHLLELKDNNLKLLSFIEKHGLKSNSFLGVPFYNELHQLILEEIDKEGTHQDSVFQVDMLLNCFSSDIYEYERFTRNYSVETYIKTLLDIFLRAL